MKVYKYKCESCGSKRCVKTDDGYQCEYCGSVQDVIIPPVPEKNEDNNIDEIKKSITKGEIDLKKRQLLIKILLCMFAGFFGMHRFYEGKILSGIFYAFTGGFFGFGILIDLLRYIVEFSHIQKQSGEQ